MPDPLSVTAGGVSALKAAFEVWKLLHDASRYPEPDKAKIQHLLEELHGHIRSAQVAVYEAEDENRTLRRKNDELQDQLAAVKKAEDLTDDMEYVQDGGFYVRKSEQARGQVIRYCPVCFGDKNQKLIPLTQMAPQGLFKCAIHKTEHVTNAYLEEQARAFQEANAITIIPNRRNPWAT